MTICLPSLLLVGQNANNGEAYLVDRLPYHARVSCCATFAWGSGANFHRIFIVSNSQQIVVLCYVNSPRRGEEGQQFTS